jgi:uncharacterized protein (TIGR03435 family)
MTLRQSTCIAAVLSIAIASGAMGQNKRPSFEVASVKRSVAEGFPDFKPRRSGDRVTMHNVRVATIVIYAYHLASGAVTTSYQLAGNLQLPEGADVYDVDAIAPGAASDEDLRLMFQVLLEDRFHLRFHRESKEMPLYDLVIAKSGSKLKASSPSGKAYLKNRPIEAEPGVSHLAGSGSMELLVGALSARLDAPVRNLSGLTGGEYDFDVPFARDPSLTTAATNLVTAVEEELGLKLKRSRGPVEVLVVDHVEKPSEN